MRDIFRHFVSELRGSWRFRWFAVGVAWIICTVGWPYVYLMPDKYESEGRVLVDMTSELNNLLDKMTLRSDVLSRVEASRAWILGRPHLEEIVVRSGMASRINSDEEMPGLIEELRSNIRVTRASQQGGSLYSITYADREPEMAYLVTDALLTSFVEGAVTENQAGNKRAQAFLQSELSGLEAELIEAEQRLAEFKRRNVGKMPSAGGDYYERLQSQLSGLEGTQTELRQAYRRRDALRQQLSGEKPTLGTVESQTELDVRILDNQRKLEELQLRFTDAYPDVIALKATLSQLHKQREDQSLALMSDDAVGIASDNPVFQSIQIELSNVNAEIASLEEREQTHERKIQELRDLVDVLPQIEAELARLNRDYNVKKGQYNALLSKLEVAELSESAERSDEVKFRMIDPPILPVEPSAPNRPVLLFAVLLGSVMSGAGIAFLLNQMKPVFQDARQVREVTGLPIIGTVLAFESPIRRRERRSEMLSFASALGVLLVLFGFVLVFHETGSSLIKAVV